MTEVIEPAAELVAAAELLRGAHRIAILSHVNPDADAIGSTLGLTGALESMGKEVTPALADEVPVYARFLEGADRVVSSLPPDAHFDVLLIADAADIQRIGALYEANPVLFQTTPILNLDHHGTNPLYGKVNYVVPSASSSSELSFNLLSCLGAPIGRAVATSLLFGIFGDTGAFQNGATTPSSMDTAASLIRDGADNQKIAFQLFERKTFEGAKLWGMVIAGITLDKDRRIVFGYMSQEMLRESGGTSDDAEGIAENLRGIEQAEVVMLLKESPDGDIRVSMRSRPAYDVAAIAFALGGGGHRQAAGVTLPGPAAAAKEKLLAAFDRLTADQRNPVGR